MKKKPGTMPMVTPAMMSMYEKSPADKDKKGAKEGSRKEIASDRKAITKKKAR